MYGWSILKCCFALIRHPHLKTEILKNGYRGADSLKYNKITILGLKLRPHAVAVNGGAVRRDAFSYELNGVRAVLRNYEKS